MGARTQRRKAKAPPRPVETSASLDGERDGGGSTQSIWWLLPIILVATAVAYQPAWHGGMLWDDNAHLTRADLRSTAGLARIWFDVGATQQYYPVVHSTFWLLHRLAGDDTLAYHLLNISLHSVSAFLVALILRRLHVPGAMLAAVIFALHPMQVESVAWMTELKNTLSGACVLAAALAWVRFDDTRQAGACALALALFIAALLSKSVTAILPAALLVVCWWRRGTIAGRRDIYPLLPFFAAGLTMGLTTAWFERALNGARGLEFQLTPIDRVLIAGRALWFYAWTLVWPAQLTFIYPKWSIDASQWWQYIFPLGVLVVLVLLWRLQSRNRGLIAAALLYGGTLMPALGFVDVYPFRYSYVADHFAYLAVIPLIALGSAALLQGLSRWLPRMRAETVLSIGVGVLLAAMTWSTAQAYADAGTLYRATLSRNPSCWLCHNNLATPRLSGSAADLAEAEAHIAEALRLNPDYAEARNNLGGILQRKGRFEEALHEHQKAFQLNPDLVEALYNVGVCEQALGRLDQAIVHYSEAVRLQPDYTLARYNLGTALQAAGRFDEAGAAYRAALAAAPDFGDARCGLGAVLASRGLMNDALVELRECVRRVPGSAGAHDMLGSVLAQTGNAAEAIAEYRAALALQPNLAATHYKLGISLAGTGRTEEAAAEFRESLKYDPDSAQAHHDLGVALANLGRMREAVAEFTDALRLRPDYAAAQADLEKARRLVR